MDQTSDAIPPNLTFPGGHPFGVQPPPSLREPRRRGRAVRFITIVCCVAAGTITYTLTRHYVEGLFGRADSGAETAQLVTVVAPKKLGTLPQSTEASLREVVDEFRPKFESTAKTTGATSFVLAFYGSTKKDDVVAMFAFAKPTSFPAVVLESFLVGATGGEAIVFTDVDPGPLGGKAKCGTTTAAFKVPDTGMCAWSDNGSVGALIFYGKPITEQLRARFLAARSQIEQPTPSLPPSAP